MQLKVVGVDWIALERRKSKIEADGEAGHLIALLFRAGVLTY